MKMALTAPRSLLYRLVRGCRFSSFRYLSDVNTFGKDTLRIRNGLKSPYCVFSRGEIEGRVAKLRKVMEDQGLAACLFTSIHNINYFTGGFVYSSFGRRHGLLVTPEKHVTITPLVDYGMPWRRSPEDNLIYSDWKVDNFFRAVVEELATTRGAVGVEYDHMNVEGLKKLKAHLPHGNEIKDVAPEAMTIRMRKTQEEIDIIKKSAAIAELGFQACVDAIGENVPEYKVAQPGIDLMIELIAKEFPESDLLDTWAYFQSGINTDGAHNPLTTRKVQKGDILSLNVFPMPLGYYSAVERTLFLDHCSDAHLKVWEANVAVHKRGIELLKPGARICDVVKELNELFAQFGLRKYRTIGYGHSFGVLSNYYGREAALELREDIDTVLEPGMVLSMEPMVVVPEGQPGAGGYREHDLIIFNLDGSVEDVTQYPFGPEHNILRR